MIQPLTSFVQLFKSLTASPSVSKGTGSISEPNLHAPVQGSAMELPTSRNRSVILPFLLLYISFCNWVIRICLAGGNFLRRKPRFDRPGRLPGCFLVHIESRSVWMTKSPRRTHVLWAEHLHECKSSSLNSEWDPHIQSSSHSGSSKCRCGLSALQSRRSIILVRGA